MLARKEIGKARAVRKGVFFDHFSADFEPEIVKASLPEIVTIPLKQGFGCENPSLVKKGDKVKAGQIIGRDDSSISTPVHSSVSGKVIDVVEINYIHEHLKENLGERIGAVKIATAGEKLENLLERAGPQWENKEPGKIRQLLYLGGVSCLGQTGIPTEYVSSPASPQDIKNIIINGVISEPFVHFTAKLPEEIDNYRIGLSILSHIFPQATVHVAVDKNTFEQFKTSHGFRDKIKLYSIRPKHPQGLGEVLIWSLLGDKLPYGTLSIDKGVLVLEGEAPLIVYQAVVEGKPFIRRRFSIGGTGVKREVVVDAPLGISLKEVIDPLLYREAKFRLMIGGALTGSYQEDLSLPIGKEIDSVVVLEEKIEREFLSFLRPGLRRPSYSRTFLSSLIPTQRKEVDTNLHGEGRPCISCGFCEQVCPADILPYQIYRCFTHNLIDEVERLRPLECIDCGLCSYVCPSKLPLTKTLKECKSKLSQEFNFVAYRRREGRLELHKNFLSDSVKEITDAKPKG